MKSILLFLFSGLTAGLFAQKGVVKLEIEPKVTQVGEEILITVKTNVQGEIDIDFPSAFVNGYAVMNGMEQEMDYSTGRVISYYYYSQNGVLKKEGTYTFGPAYVKTGSKIYKSNTVEVTIQKEPIVNSTGEISAKQLKQVAFGVIEYTKKKIYEGEPLILNAKVYSRFYPTHIEDYQSYNADGIIDKHELSSSNRLVAEEERIKNIDFYAVTYDRSLVFPNGVGKMQIDPFKLILKRGFEGVPVVSTGTVVEVLSLPENQPKSFIGMVGKLALESKVSKTEIKKGDVFSIKLTLTGAGNLHNTDYPKLNLPKGLTLYGDPKADEKYVFTANGAEGKINYEYTIQVNKDGSFLIPSIEVAYFDLKSKKYIRLKSDEINLKGEEVKMASIQSNGKTKVIAEKKIDHQDNENSNGGSLLKSPFLWISISSLALIAGFIGFTGKNKKTTTIAFDKSTVTQEPTVIYSWKDVDSFLALAEIAYQNNDNNSMFSALENAILLGLKVSVNEHDSVLTSNQLLNRLSYKINNPELIFNLSKSLEICQNARYGFEFNSEDKTTILPGIKLLLNSLRSYYS